MLGDPPSCCPAWPWGLPLLSPSPWAILASLLSHLLEGSGGGSEHLASGSTRRGLGKRLCGHTPVGVLHMAPLRGSRMLIHPLLGS